MTVASTHGIDNIFPALDEHDDTGTHAESGQSVGFVRRQLRAAGKKARGWKDATEIVKKIGDRYAP
jgi:hypothetical protein